jgi:protein-tyrosine phosphatase
MASRGSTYLKQHKPGPHCDNGRRLAAASAGNSIEQAAGGGGWWVLAACRRTVATALDVLRHSCLLRAYLFTHAHLYSSVAHIFQDSIASQSIAKTDLRCLGWPSTLHKLRALRRKARLTSTLTTDHADAAMAAVPSPTSSKRSRSRDSSGSSLSTPAMPTPLTTPSISTHSLAMHDGAPYPAFLRLSMAEASQRWNALENAQLERMRDGSDEWARCNTEEHAPRNRYANVDPYRANRVRLVVPEGHNDYINASPIVLTTTKGQRALRYIATQGPKGDSWAHLWRMVWTESPGPAVVVMLTQTHEAGREKCFPYYPQAPEGPAMRVNEHDEFGDAFTHTLNLASLHQDPTARTQVREIDMAADDGSGERKVWHLLFAGWPDFSVPEGADKAALLRLLDISRDKGGDSVANPHIVHCSAGIGRSGTFIALDWLLQELDEGAFDEPLGNQDPVVAVIENMRDQRFGMVQSKQQFLFLYDALRDRWRDRWIAQHPAEAATLGITPAPVETEPALKRQKSMPGGGGEVLQPTTYVSDAAASPHARAALEAELQDAAASYEHGKT